MSTHSANTPKRAYAYGARVALADVDTVPADLVGTVGHVCQVSLTHDTRGQVVRIRYWITSDGAEYPMGPYAHGELEARA